MALRDSAQRYGTLSRALHWLMAALIIWQLTGMIVKNIFGRVDWVGFWVGTHASVGVLLFTLALVRIVWAIAQRGNRPPQETGVLGRLAGLGHLALYGLMLLVSGLGTLRLLGGERPASVFGVSLHSGNTPEIAWMVAPANAVHGLLGWALLLLIVGHVGMVAIHHFVWKDGTVKRMIGR